MSTSLSPGSFSFAMILDLRIATVSEASTLKGTSTLNEIYLRLYLCRQVAWQWFASWLMVKCCVARIIGRNGSNTLILVVLHEVGWKRGHPSFKEKRRSLLKVYCCNVLADPALPAAHSHSLSINTPPQLKIIPESWSTASSLALDANQSLFRLLSWAAENTRGPSSIILNWRIGPMTKTICNPPKTNSPLSERVQTPHGNMVAWPKTGFPALPGYTRKPGQGIDKPIDRDQWLQLPIKSSKVTTTNIGYNVFLKLARKHLPPYGEYRDF